MKRQLLVLMLVCAVITTGVFAQTDAPPTKKKPAAAPQKPVGPDPNQPKAESVFKHIPADCLGFAVAPNLKDLLAQSETFAGQIGLGEMLKSLPGGLLPMIAMPLGLGEGYNPNGGVAVVVPDLEKCGFDIEKAIAGNNPGEFPFVVLLAGKSVKAVFPQMATKGKDGKTTVMLAGKPMHTAQVGQYVALSPNAKALAIVVAKTTALPKAHVALLNKSAVGIHVNMKAYAVFVKKVMKAQEKQMAGRPMRMGGMSGLFAMQQGMMKNALGQLDQMGGASIGLRFVKTGMMMDVMADVAPGSNMAKMMAKFKPTAKPLMNRLPNLPYCIAGGSTMPGVKDQAMVAQFVDMVTNLLAMGEMKMTDDFKTRMTKLIADLSEQVTGMQMVVGAPKNKGLFGAAMVIECKDAEKTKALINKKALLITELVQKTIGLKEKDVATLEFKYTKGVETVAGTSVDTIEVIHENLTTLEDDEKQELLDVLGEDKIRILIAQVDPKTLVVTVGGSKEFLAEAITAARKGGTINKDAGVIAARKMLPRELVRVVVISPDNVFTTVQAGMNKMGQPSMLPADFKFEGKTPIIMGGTVKGNMAIGAVYVPSSAVKDIYNWAQSMMMNMMGGRPGGRRGAPPAGGDF
ncbi:MAG: hypothetical protein K8S55_01975 [Phycisphaerae bacterium]|nr:hypothetical protein [Phycisphaerae bacterium]